MKLPVGPAQWSLWLRMCLSLQPDIMLMDLAELDTVLDNNWNAGARTGVFFVAMSVLPLFRFQSLTSIFAVCSAYAGATILTSLANNSIPFGADVTGLFPRWLTIVRGQLIIFVSVQAVWVYTPFIICCSLSGTRSRARSVEGKQTEQSSFTFLTTVSAVSFIGVRIYHLPWLVHCVMWSDIRYNGIYFFLHTCIRSDRFFQCADYYVLRRQNLHAPSLYTSGEGDIYWYFKGFNLKACFAWVCAVAIVSFT